MSGITSTVLSSGHISQGAAISNAGLLYGAKISGNNFIQGAFVLYNTGIAQGVTVEGNNVVTGLVVPSGGGTLTGFGQRENTAGGQSGTLPIVGTVGATGAQGAPGGITADRWPGLVAPYTPLLIAGAVAIGTNTILACRVVIPQAGTLHDLAIWIGASSGNVRIGVYDTGDALAGSRTKLYDSGSVASPGVGWRILADPALIVTQGQQLDFTVVADNATVTIGRYTGIGSGSPSLPTNFWLAAGGASPKLSWSSTPGSFTLPSAITEAGCTITSLEPFIMGRVV